MANAGSRYDMTITMEITRADGSPFASTTQKYHDMTYEVMAETESVGIGALLQAFSALGARDAEIIKASRGNK